MGQPSFTAGETFKNVGHEHDVREIMIFKGNQQPAPRNTKNNNIKGWGGGGCTEEPIRNY